VKLPSASGLIWSGVTGWMTTPISTTFSKMASGYSEAFMSKLFYLMGPSGSGKDALMTGVREHFDGQGPVLFAHRYITRCWRSGGENHIELSDEEFDQRLRAGLFAMHWRANDCRYGIGLEVEGWLSSGHSVLVNGSREHLEEARKRFGNRLVPVLVCVEANQLKQRLLARGREPLQQIEQRLERNQRFMNALEDQSIMLDNSGALDQSIARFAALLEQQVRETAGV
jgi:ribose 1,5-bisphosphokinase